jgi:ribosomal protein L27
VVPEFTPVSVGYCCSISVVPEFTPVSVGLLWFNLRGTRVHPGFSRLLLFNLRGTRVHPGFSRLLLLNLRGTRVHPGFSRVIVVQSLVLLYVVVCGPYFCLFAFCSLLAIAFSLWFVCLSFDIQHLVIPLVSLNISYEYSYAQCSQRKYNAVNNTH